MTTKNFFLKITYDKKKYLFPILLFFLLLTHYNISAQRLMPFSEKNKTTTFYGLKDDKGKVIIPAKYQAIGDFNDDRAFVSLNGKYGFIDKSGKVVIPIIYACRYTYPEGPGDVYHIRIENFSNGIARIQVAKNSTLDKNGMLDPDDRLPDNIKYGVIDKMGKQIVPTKYDFLEIKNEGQIFVTTKEKLGIFDKNGKVILEPIYDGISKPFEDFVIVNLNNDSYILNLKTKEKVEVKYEIVSNEFNEFGLIKVRSKSNGLYGYINKQAAEIIKIKYVGLREFSEGFLCAYDGVHYGFLNSSGNVAINFKYDLAQSFSNGKASVRFNHQSFFINKEDKEVK